MPDLDAIAVALAARFAPGIATPPAPGGLTDIREATANLPNALGMLPAVLVFTERGSFPEQRSGTRLGLVTFRVRFYLAGGVDLARDEVQLRQWTTVLVDRLKPAFVTLGGLVARIVVTDWSIGALRYVDDWYSGIELVCVASTSEAWS
jgi:hypothetical protein